MNKQQAAKILGVETSASNDEAKKAYRRLAQKYHPDKETGDEAKFREALEALEAFSKPDYANGDDVPYDWAHNHFEEAMRGFYRASNRDYSEQMRKIQGRGKDYRVKVLVDLEDLFFSRTVSVNIPKETPCGKCKDKEAFSKCEECRGHRKNISMEPMEFTMPKGIVFGSSLLIRGAGGRPKYPDCEPGNVEIVVFGKKHPLFSIDGEHNLHIDLYVDYKTLLHGGEVTIPLFSKDIKLRIPKGFESGKKLVARGEGLPIGSKGEVTNLICCIRLETPEIDSYEVENKNELIIPTSFDDDKEAYPKIAKQKEMFESYVKEVRNVS